MKQSIIRQMRNIAAVRNKMTKKITRIILN